MAEPMTATHVTICMRIVASHRNMRHISVDAARGEVLALADDAERGLIVAGTEKDRLREKLERATGCTLAELAKIARGWA